MNKGLELIEAYHLFPVTAEQLGVVIHPQSIVHCLVSYTDGSVLAQMSCPDMRTPIALALSWPQRMTTPTPRLDLAAIGSLSFEAPDEARFPALTIARDALALRRHGAGHPQRRQRGGGRGLPGAAHRLSRYRPQRRRYPGGGAGSRADRARPARLGDILAADRRGSPSGTIDAWSLCVGAIAPQPTLGMSAEIAVFPTDHQWIRGPAYSRARPCLTLGR